MTLFKKFWRRDAASQATPPVESISAAAAEADVARSLEHSLGREMLGSLLKERRSELWWKNFRRVVISGSGVILFGIYVFFNLTSLGYKLVPSSDIVGVVSIRGDIMAGSKTASAEVVVEALKKAFDKPNVKAIVLNIDSPGGQPGEAERIYSYLEHRRATDKKPVIAVVGNTGASAAYMIAVHADKIYAGKYSMVGSIGAILATWDFHKVAERFDVARKVYASGDLKGMLDPWSPTSPEAEAKGHDLVNRMGGRFADEVTTLRGTKLKKGVNFFTGEVWTGEQARDLGLVDEIASLDVAIQQNYDLPSHDFGPVAKQSGFPLGLESFVGPLADAIAARLIR